jgi:RNA polymerase-binding transcription factor DksA
VKNNKSQKKQTTTGKNTTKNNPAANKNSIKKKTTTIPVPNKKTVKKKITPTPTPQKNKDKTKISPNKISKKITAKTKPVKKIEQPPIAKNKKQPTKQPPKNTTTQKNTTPQKKNITQKPEPKKPINKKTTTKKSAVDTKPVVKPAVVASIAHSENVVVEKTKKTSLDTHRNKEIAPNLPTPKNTNNTDENPPTNIHRQFNFDDPDDTPDQKPNNTEESSSQFFVRSTAELAAKQCLSESELETYRQKLTAMRSRLRGDVSTMTDAALSKSRLDASGDLSAMPIHMADVGSDNFEQEQTLSFMQNERGILADIEEALLRVKDKTYGVCEGCGNPIPKIRLNFIPYANMCVKCAELAQQEEND